MVYMREDVAKYGRLRGEENSAVFRRMAIRSVLLPNHENRKRFDIGIGINNPERCVPKSRAAAPPGLEIRKLFDPIHLVRGGVVD